MSAEEIVVSPALNTEKIPQAGDQSPEKIEQQASFLARIRTGIAQELKFAFTLPRPGKGLMRDLSMKGLGYSGVAIGAIMGEQAQGGNVYHMAAETPQQFQHTEQLLEGAGGMIAILGATSIFMANRLRSQQIKDDAAFQERLKNSRQ